MSPAREPKPQVPEVVERLVKQLVVTHKAAGLYPASSAIPRENAAICLGLLRSVLQRRGEMQLAVAKEGLFYEGVPVFPEHPVFQSFALELYNRNLTAVRFHAGITDRDLLSFFEVLRLTQVELIAGGGFENQMWERQADSITVVEVATKIVDADLPEGEDSPDVFAGEPWPPSPSRIDDILVGAFGGRPRDQRVLVRIMRSPDIVRSYFEESLSSRGTRPPEAVVMSHLASFANMARAEPPADQPALLRSLAEALLGLDPELRTSVVRDRLLGDARKDEALAAIVRSMSLDEVCVLLAEGLADGAGSVEGVSRAVRNLALISMAGHEEVAEAVQTALGEAGCAAETVTAVMDGVAPARLVVRERPRTPEDDPVDSVVRLVDMVPAPRPDTEDAELAPLRLEARAGITDADIMGALVTLVTLEVRPEPFASIMALVEDNLGLLLERDEFGAAADAAAALVGAEDNRALSTVQRRRVRNAITSLARKERMRTINRAMRVYPPGSDEQTACRRLLGILGTHAIEPLLEALGEEQDMGARKAMVDLVSEVAPEHIAELGEHVSDKRWFFVRNVVAILGTTHRPEALQYLERTLRHFDPRVRRETIRAAASIRDLRAEQMLASALSDDDAQNVTLAARNLGNLASRSAVPSLEVVARGEGTGNRDVGARVDAIQALAKIAQPTSADVLEVIATRKGLLRREPKEVTAAAQAAVHRIRAAAAKGGAES